jgi:hypothetical protein
VVKQQLKGKELSYVDDIYTVGKVIIGFLVPVNGTQPCISNGFVTINENVILGGLNPPKQYPHFEKIKSDLYIIITVHLLKKMV